MVIHKEGLPMEIAHVIKTRLITRRNWMNMGDTKIYSNYLTSYPDVLDKRFYSLSYVKRRV